MQIWKTLLCASALAMAGTAAAAAEAPLRIISIDVEGGSATLYVTPQGHSMLIDTGWPGTMGSGQDPNGKAPTPLTSAQRIVAAAKAAGLTKLDYVVVTHYHVDHAGGINDLVKLFPVGMFIDHGPNRETPIPGRPARELAYRPELFYPKYLAAVAGKPRRIMHAGETLKIDGLVITAIDSDGERIPKPLPAGRKQNPYCAKQTENTAYNGGEENRRSLGFLMTWGKARILSLADTTWNMENTLVCPVDRIGPVDLMFVDNHGSTESNSPTLIDTVEPIVMIIPNGPRKGGDPETFDTVMASPRIKGIWQVHYALHSSAQENAPEDQIANLAGVPDAINPLKIDVDKDGTIIVTNPRNGVSKKYHS